MFSVFFTEGPVRDFARRAAQDTAAYAAFFHAMLDRGRVPAAVGVRGVVRLRGPRRPRGQTVLDALPAAAAAAAAPGRPRVTDTTARRRSST